MAGGKGGGTNDEKREEDEDEDEGEGEEGEDEKNEERDETMGGGRHSLIDLTRSGWHGHGGHWDGIHVHENGGDHGGADKDDCL